MSNKILLKLQLHFRKLFRYFEVIFFLAKEVLSERNFIYLSSVAIAFSCSLAVIFLKTFSHQVFIGANRINSFLKLPFSNSLLPIVGILLTILVVKRFLGGKIDKGSSKILHSIAKKGGKVPRKQMYAQIMTSSLTVGLGGSAGLESPIVITGAAFGSNYAQNYKLSQKDRILLLACGVASGIGCAFNAPIAGVLFAIEVILADMTISAFIPIMIAAATGALTSKIFLSDDIILRFEHVKDFDFKNTLYYIILGVFAGFVSIYHARTFRKVEHFFKNTSKKRYVKGLIGSITLGGLIFLFPTLFGEGYESIKTLSTSHPQILLENTLLENFQENSWVFVLFIGLIVFVKSIATGITLGSGGNGGNFAPSLFVGSYLGFLVAKLLALLHIAKVPITNFTIVGMAGILSGLFHAPLTAIFLIGEITGGYDLMIPLMIVSSISFAISKHFEKHSMDVKSLAPTGEVYTSNKDKNILQSIDIKSLINKNIDHLFVEDNLENLIQLLSTKQQNVFPVLNQDREIVGIVDFNWVKNIVFNSFQVKYSTVKQVMQTDFTVNDLYDNLETILKKYEKSNQEILMVIHNNQLYGLINKLDILEEYRNKYNEIVIE